MVELSAAQITGLVSLALVLTGVIIVNNLEDSYYCASEDNVKECLRLSPSGITCYYLAAEDLTKGDRCTGGVWESLDSYLVSQIDIPIENVVKVRANNKEWICPTDAGFINNYTRCNSGKYTGYVGEFI